jgi:hypothetical protein
MCLLTWFAPLSVLNMKRGDIMALSDSASEHGVHELK